MFPEGSLKEELHEAPFPSAPLASEEETARRRLGEGVRPRPPPGPHVHGALAHTRPPTASSPGAAGRVLKTFDSCAGRGSKGLVGCAGSRVVFQKAGNTVLTTCVWPWR